MESTSNSIKSIIDFQYVTQKNSISKDRIANTEKITIIEDLIKCSICKSYEYKVCLFGKDWINEWLKINPTYPIRYENFKIIHSRTIQEKY